MKKNYRNIYFIGIGGIGMSALARYFKFKGYKVSGYDRTPSELTAELEAEGIPVHYEDDVKAVPKGPSSTLVVYTPAVPESLQELKYVQEKNYKVVKRSRILGEITDGQTCLAVAGTHGKTTTSTLIAHILTESGEGCSAFLGGISKNYDTNMLMSHTPVAVAEADEFDRSFLQLHPAIAVITAIEADHLDVYGDLEHVEEAFGQFASQVSDTIIAKYNLPITGRKFNAKVMTYHFDDKRADFYGENLRLDPMGYYTYNLVHPDGILENIKVGAPGWVNVENSIGAAAACLCHGVSPDKIKSAIGTFVGVRRRLDVHVNTGKITYIDDYAHHPGELSTAISSIRRIFPERKITGIFQPHLYTRTRDFAVEFAVALSRLDKLILLDIYPAREEPIPGVSSRIIYDRVTSPEKVLMDKDKLMKYLENENVDILVTFGAGNIDRFVEPITSMLEKRIKE